MDFGEIYINHLFDKRIMKKTHDKDLLHRIYASKYANWIIPYLNERKISKAPILLCCNTLYKLPYFYTIRDKNFFIADYGLYDYIYDLNYANSNSNRKEFIVNIYYKALAEQLYLNKSIDDCFMLCAISPDLEEYKQDNDYHNETIMTELAEKTDLQEAFLFLHEANHCYFKSNSDIQESVNYKLIKSMYQSSKINITDESFYEECFCDFEAVLYLFEKTYTKTQIKHKEFITMFFDVIIYLYILQSIRIYFNNKKSEAHTPLTMFSLRLNTIYFAIKEYLSKNDFDDDIRLLDNIYSNILTRFPDECSNTREIVGYIKKESEKNKNDMCFDISKDEKIKFIKDYLLLE